MYNLSFNNNLVSKDKYNQLFNLKKLFKNKILIKFITVVFSVVILANIKANNNPRFIANQGQFNKGVKFKLEHRAGNIYFENNNVKFDLFQKDKINALKHGDISVGNVSVSYTHLRAHETSLHLVCRLLLEKNLVLKLAGDCAHGSSPRHQNTVSRFFNDTATTEIYTLHIVGSVRCV